MTEEEEYESISVSENEDHSIGKRTNTKELQLIAHLLKAIDETGSHQTLTSTASESIAEQSEDENEEEEEEFKTEGSEEEDEDEEEGVADTEPMDETASKKGDRQQRFRSDGKKISGDFTSIHTGEFSLQEEPLLSIPELIIPTRKRKKVKGIKKKVKDESEEEGREAEESEEEEEGEEEIVVGGEPTVKEEEVEEKIVDRDYYYALYRKLIVERVPKRLKNNFLQRKMAEYFKKKKMEHVLKETDQQTDSQQKYDKRLTILADFKDFETRERDSITAELNDMRYQRNENQELFNHHFESMQQREREIGTGLINTKTGKPVSDKVVDRLIKRQKYKMLEVSKMRLTFIRLRDQVTEKKVHLHKLDTVGENLYLFDYEQLKIENTSHTEKLEERDDDLVKLRVKCSGSVQCLAHVREKSAALQLDLIQLTKQYDEVKAKALCSREKLNFVKLERDNYRFNIQKLKEDCGLLTKPKLLLDMEESLDDIKNLESKVQHQIKLYDKTKKSLKAIRINIKRENPQRPIDKKRKTRRIHKGRPTIVYSSALPPMNIS